VFAQQNLSWVFTREMKRKRDYPTEEEEGHHPISYMYNTDCYTRAYIKIVTIIISSNATWFYYTRSIMLPTSQTQTAFFLREIIIQKLSWELAATRSIRGCPHTQNTRAPHYNNMHITFYIFLSHRINAFFRSDVGLPSHLAYEYIIKYEYNLNI